MFFSNVAHLTVKSVIFENSPEFSLQTGNAKNLFFYDIQFKNCFADGLHINGNSENVFAQKLCGQVGDDIFALNMYDWERSSINFGPTRNVWCEDVELSADSRYKAIRILPGVYVFDDGTKLSCDAENIVLKNIRGINNFKMYLQTDVYSIDEPHIVEPGNGDHIFFEDISVSLEKPIDELPPYLQSDPVTGTIAAFEFGAKLKNVHLENIRLSLYKDKYPYSYLAAAGPKSCLLDEKTEVFDPYVESSVENLYLKDIYVNGTRCTEQQELIREISFEKLYDSPYASGKGRVHKIVQD